MVDSPSLEIGNSRDFGEIRAEVHKIVQAIAPEHDLTYIDQAFALIESASKGILLGYSSLLTPYHDQGHVLEVVLCSARLLHSLHLAGHPVDSLAIDAGIVGSLLHDAGYLMEVREASGSGAQFTSVHVVRGVVFAETQLGELLPAELMSATGKAILATDHRRTALLPEFSSESQRLAAWVTGTADLVGQMANRAYLERLLLLYYEFREAGITAYTDVHDMMEKTGGFYSVTNSRLQQELGNLAHHLQRHFLKERGVDRNYYVEAIARNLDYLRRLLKEDRTHRLDQLRRGGIIERALDLIDSDEDK